MEKYLIIQESKKSSKIRIFLAIGVLFAILIILIIIFSAPTENNESNNPKEIYTISESGEIWINPDIYVNNPSTSQEEMKIDLINIISIKFFKCLRDIDISIPRGGKICTDKFQEELSPIRGFVEVENIFTSDYYNEKYPEKTNLNWSKVDENLSAEEAKAGSVELLQELSKIYNINKIPDYN